MSVLLMQLRRAKGLASRNEHHIKRVGAVVAAFSLAAAGANLWVGHKASGRLYEDFDAVPARHTAIVLGARVNPDGTPSATLEDRLFAGLELYRRHKVKKILVSGDHAAKEYDEVNAMWRWLEERGVPEKDVFLDHAGLRTLDTMERARGVFMVEDAVVCTQEFHLPRSVFLALRAGIDAVGIRADRRRYYHHRRNQAREFAARSVAFFDTYIFHTTPKFMGDPIPIQGDGTPTHDK